LFSQSDRRAAVTQFNSKLKEHDVSYQMYDSGKNDQLLWRAALQVSFALESVLQLSSRF